MASQVRPSRALYFDKSALYSEAKLYSAPDKWTATRLVQELRRKLVVVLDRRVIGIHQQRARHVAVGADVMHHAPAGEAADHHHALSGFERIDRGKPRTGAAAHG